MDPEAKGTAEVIYEGRHTTVGHRVAVALGTAGTLVALVAFVRWGFGGPQRFGPLVSPAVWALAGAIAAVMTAAAFVSRVVWRVTLDGASLRLDRDPGATERYALADLSRVESVASGGGWSRDPSERLCLHLRDGRTVVRELPDDADTPGIVKDITAAIGQGRGLETRP